MPRREKPVVRLERQRLTPLGEANVVPSGRQYLHEEVTSGSPGRPTNQLGHS